MRLDEIAKQFGRIYTAIAIRWGIIQVNPVMHFKRSKCKDTF